jgi:hypothetical protein
VTVSAIIVTRGDVDLAPIVASLPIDWQVVICDNSGKLTANQAFRMRKYRVGDHMFWPHSDLSVYGRYASIPSAKQDLIYIQDDDCIVSDSQAIVDAWKVSSWARQDYIVANMPQEFRLHYPDSCLVGFGACFHRDLPAKAFERFLRPTRMDPEGGWIGYMDSVRLTSSMLRRTCDVVFTTLTPRVLVDVPVEVLPYAHDEGRMWKQPNHFGERTQVLEMARKVRDA